MMKHTARTMSVLAAAAAALFLRPAALFAHGVEVSDRGNSDGALRAVRFMYSTGEPMMYAKIKLFPPARPDTEILSSITDRNGIFAFLPDSGGDWRIEAEDGMGHKGTITVAAGLSGNGAAPEQAGISPGGAAQGGRPPLSLAIVLGLSLIVNVFAVWHYAGLRKGSALKKSSPEKGESGAY
jgi:nickel transport protein